MGLEPQSSPAGPTPMRWRWVVTGVAVGAVVIVAFLNAVDPYLDRPAVDGLIGSLTVLLVGIVVGAGSRGETLREAGVAGLMLAVLTIALVAFQLRIPIPTLLWITGPFAALVLGLFGGYVGEMLQGTLDEAHVDRPIDWPWVFVGVVIGFTLSSYGSFLAHAWLSPSSALELAVLTSAFLVAGVVVGFFSPGKTMVEPAIAAGGLILAHVGFLAAYADPAPGPGWISLAFGLGIVLALVGGWLGEKLQESLRRT